MSTRVRPKIRHRRNTLRHVLRNEISREPAVLLITEGNHDRGTNLRVRAENGFDLAGFDTEATHLDLLIRPAHEVQLPIGKPTAPVTRAVHARTVSHEGVGKETLTGQGRT
ncbi:hypothetical protein ACFZCB_44785, partial [Streptomyces pseudovenezuelae]|uniref:hypothetical protein n=1 Tax=Streptomyces pseudovenezuelae TaxID=67350 RepID=UPI0036E7CDAC